MATFVMSLFKMAKINIGLVGFGTVGVGVCKILQEQAELIKRRSNAEFEVIKVAMRDVNKKREITLPSEAATTDWQEVVNHPDVNLVVELIGGTTTAFEVVSSALKLGKPVVTGNKALLAERGEELFALAQQQNTPIYFEASVAGGIPIIKTLREAFVGNEVLNLAGIINGTCNYILERMTDAGLSYQDALKEAMDLGYAEADPTLDINGWDAGHKAILLGAMSYGFLPDPAQTYVTGIENVQLSDITLADKLGYAIKLVSVIKPASESTVEIRTQASFVPKTHLLAKVDGVFNAVAISGDTVGDSFIYGRGAGEGPTATAVVADLVDAAQSVGGTHRGYQPYDASSYSVAPIEETVTAYFVNLDVKDEPGVMATITSAFSDHGISFSGTFSNVDPQAPDAEMNQVSFITHAAKLGSLLEALSNVEKLDCVTAQPRYYRVESFS